MTYRGYYIVMHGGRYTVYASYEPQFKSYVGRKGTFNDATSARRYVNELHKARQQFLAESAETFAGLTEGVVPVEKQP